LVCQPVDELGALGRRDDGAEPGGGAAFGGCDPGEEIGTNLGVVGRIVDRLDYVQFGVLF